MARIIYGVMGDSGGHISRALAVAAEFPEHEFLFVGGGAVRTALDHGHRYSPLPMLSTALKDNRVLAGTTAVHFARVILGYGGIIDGLCRLIREFKPDAAVTDYEFFLPRAARKVGLKCVSLDRQHVITHCDAPRPPDQRLNRLTTSSLIRALFSASDVHLVSSFGDPAPIRDRTRVVPPILRRDILDHAPSRGGHALVYLRSGLTPELARGLEATNRECRVFGTGEVGTRGNLRFLPPSRAGFLETLASCDYVVCNGGYGLVCEALHLGKPVLAFPVAFFYEQWVNAHHLATLGWGGLGSLPLGEVGLARFEERLPVYRRNLEGVKLFGNQEAAAALTSEWGTD